MFFKSMACAVVLLASSHSFAKGTPEHSKVAVSQKKQGEGLTLSFKIEPNKGMNATFDAPWKLVVEGKDLNFAKTTLGKADMDTALPGFVLTTTARPNAPKGQIKYTLTSFICTKEKTQCYREVHTGAFDWSLDHP